MFLAPHAPTPQAHRPDVDGRSRPVANAPTVAPALSVAQVLHHVAVLAAPLDPPVGIERLAEAADVCGRLVGARRQFFVALSLRQHVERVMQVARGREPVRPAWADEHQMLRSVEISVQACVDEAQLQWRRMGQRFTRLTHLLPTQLDPQLGLPPPLTPTQHQALMSAFVRSGVAVPTERFEAVLEAYMVAHRRCQGRVGPALAARERRQRAERDGRGGPLPVDALALAMFEEFLSRQSLLVAEAERAGAHHMLHVLADLPSFRPS
ncbi:MAG: hypothetical protein IBJ14_10865 [Hydrogenophaga sp.]|nr:hypothetical protein [Hydrogenophaga sp.]